MKYKIVACDMDGTLLNGEGQLTERTVSTINRCANEGLYVTLCTGRPYVALAPYLEKLDIRIPLITYNGGILADAKTGEALYERGLSKEDTLAVLEVGKKLGISMTVWARNELFMNRMDEMGKIYKKAVFVEPVMFDPENPCFTDRNVTKYLWYAPEKDVKELMKVLPGMLPDTVACFTSTPEYIEIVRKDVNKGDALYALCDCLGIPREESVAVGDGLNDLSMIKAAGLGVAMKNAAEEVTKAAKYVTSSNNEDGVAELLCLLLEGRLEKES